MAFFTEIGMLPLAATAGVIPLVVGMVWYHPKVMGNIWMKEVGINMDDNKGRMVMIMGVTFVLNFFIAVSLHFMTVHQYGLYSMLQGVPDLASPDSEASKAMKFLMDSYGHNFRTFKHGSFHGILTALLFATPIIVTGAIYERRSFKYVAITAGYWIVSLALMGGLICHAAKTSM
jgi:hypothetical protein